MAMNIHKAHRTTQARAMNAIYMNLETPDLGPPLELDAKGEAVNPSDDIDRFDDLCDAMDMSGDWFDALLDDVCDGDLSVADAIAKITA